MATATHVKTYLVLGLLELVGLVLVGLVLGQLRLALLEVRRLGRLGQKRRRREDQRTQQHQRLHQRLPPLLPLPLPRLGLVLLHP